MSPAEANGERTQAMDEQQQRQAENNGLQRGHSTQKAMQELGEENVDYIREIMEDNVTIVEECGFENFLSNDFVLANFDAKEIEAMRWQMWIAWEKIMAAFPDESDYITGAQYMENYYGVDPSSVPTDPLSASQKNSLHAIRRAAHARISRSEDMKQQDMFTKSVAESRVRRDGENNEKGGLRGLFS